jgi:nicotinamidase/pyrazinamidase
VKKRNAVLLVIDVQKDFCPGGTLAIGDGDAIVPIVNRIAARADLVLATQDWHPHDHVSFARNHPGKNPYDVVELDGIKQVLWPPHCVQGTDGADFHAALNTEHFSLILRKGTDARIDSYSAFQENDKKTNTGLEGYLRGLGIEHIYLCGLATDYCVFYSAMDAVRLGLRVSIVIDACRGVDIPTGSIEKALNKMKKHGVAVLNSSELP